MVNTSYSLYPNNLDGYNSLPLRRDGVHEIRAEDHNRLRDCIVKIEQELGIQPSGTYATVADRLDNIGDASAAIDAHIADPTDAHDASAISILDSRDIFFTSDLESVLEELGLMLDHKPDKIGENRSWISNSGIPSFYDGYGTKFLYNVSDWTGEATDNDLKRTQPRPINGLRGIHIIEVSPATNNGTAWLTYNQSNDTLTWQAPGDSPGTAIDISGLSTGETATIRSSNTSFAIRIARTSDTLPVSAIEEQFEVYGLEAAHGIFSIDEVGLKQTSYITRTATSSTGVSRHQFMIGGTVYPADSGTLVLQRKRRNDDNFYPIAALDLSTSFNSSLRETTQPVYIPTLSNYDTITLYDRLPALRDYSSSLGADGSQIYDDFTYNYNYNTQVAKYLIPASNSDIVGGELTSPEDTTYSEIYLGVSAYRVVHYKPNITNFTGEPSASDIYSVDDEYQNNHDGDNTVRFSNLYVDPNPNRPGVELIHITPPNPILATDSYKYLSGIRYYDASSSNNYFLFRLRSNDNFASNTFIDNGILKLTTNVFNIPNGVEDDGYSRYGAEVDLGALLDDDAYQAYSSDNLPEHNSKAWYLVSTLIKEETGEWEDYNYYIDRAFTIPADRFSTRARITARFHDPFGPGDGYDGYGDDESVIFRSKPFRDNLRTRVLVNSYTSRSTDSKEYFSDEDYRIGESETFLFPTNEDRFTYDDGIHVRGGGSLEDGYVLAEWNPEYIIGPSSLQSGGRWTPSETNICGLIYPQNNYMSGEMMPFQFDEELSNVSGGTGKTGYTADYSAPGSNPATGGIAANYDGYGEGQKYYQRLFSLGYPICNAQLRVVSDGDNPVAWNDIAYFNTDRFGKIEVKVPGNDGYNDTNWLDIGRLYDGNMEDGYGAANGAPTGTTGDFTVPFTFGTRNNSNSGNMVAVRVTYFSQNEYGTDVLDDSKSRIVTMLELLPPTTSE